MSHLLNFLLLFASLIVAQNTDNLTCWYDSGSTVVPQTTWLPCPNTALSLGGALLCCYMASHCGPDSICRIPNPAGPNLGFYIGGCTDGNYQDPVCSGHCSSYNSTGIIYNTTDQLWSCCGDNRSCDTPTNETFAAIPQARWSAISPALTTTSASSTPTSTSDATADKDKGDGLSGGDIAGVVVGVISGVGAVVAAIAAIIPLYRKRKEKRKDPVGKLEDGQGAAIPLRAMNGTHPTTNGTSEPHTSNVTSEPPAATNSINGAHANNPTPMPAPANTQNVGRMPFDEL